MGGAKAEILTLSTNTIHTGNAGGGFPGDGAIKTIINEFTRISGTNSNIETNITITFNSTGDEIALVQLDHYTWKSSDKINLREKKSIEFDSLPLLSSDNNGAFYTFGTNGEEACKHILRYVHQTFNFDQSIATEVTTIACKASATLTVDFY
ncbi:MAG: hypothetical protein KZQ83_20780 [gamma proteobacterium symbiont of Taylorina sp.]|nr:hypothetical protein [gamma proteobacterium symbiont of Taylorina sp.]